MDIVGMFAPAILVASLFPVAGASKVLRVGGPMQLSGTYGSLGGNATKAFELWKNWAAPFYHVELKFEDATTVGDATTIAKRMADYDEVDIVVCPYTSTWSKEVVAALDFDDRPVMVWGGASSGTFDQDVRGKNVFGTFTAAANYMDSGLEALYAKGARTAYFIQNMKGFSNGVCLGAKEKAETLGMTKLGEATVSNDGSDVLPAMSDQNLLAADVLVVCGHAADVEALITALPTMEPKPTAVLATQVATSDFRSAVESAGHGDKLCGLMMPSQWAPSQSGSPDPVVGWDTATFNKLFSELVGVEPTYHSASAGGAALALANAIAWDEQDDLDVDGMIENLKALDVDSFYGRLKFGANGQVDSKPMVTVQNRPDGSVQVVAPAMSMEVDVNYPDTCLGSTTGDDSEEPSDEGSSGDGKGDGGKAPCVKISKEMVAEIQSRGYRPVSCEEARRRRRLMGLNPGPPCATKKQERPTFHI